MTTPVRSNVKPELLRWARERADLEVGDIAKIPALKNYRLWEEGKRTPTVRQVEFFAKKTHVAVGKLFLSKPPKEEMPIPDLRTAKNKQAKRFNAELYDTVNMCLSRQDWYLEYLAETGKKQLDFVGAVGTNSNPERVAQQIRQRLNFDLEQRSRLKTWEEALRIFVDTIERIGIMVMISGVVGNDTSRSLDTKEFRGFALVNKFAPLIFINGRDSKAAQMFTLAFELAHIWSNKSGISNYSVNENADYTKVERWCNSVADEILVPKQELLKKLDVLKEISIIDKARLLTKYFKVSDFVILKRLYGENLIDFTTFQEEMKNLVLKSVSTQAIGSNFYFTLRNRLGKRFSEALVQSTLDKKVLHRDAMWLIGVKQPATFDGFAKIFESR